MGIEIERKFLVRNEGWQAGVVGGSERFIQGYIKTPDDGVSEVRIRIVEPSEGQAHANIAIKSVGGLSRTEVEVPVDIEQAYQLLALCNGVVVNKTRYRVPTLYGLIFEVDVYAEQLAGLVTVDCEVPSEDTIIPTPDWLGEEITGRLEFANAVMAKQGLPFCTR